MFGLLPVSLAFMPRLSSGNSFLHKQLTCQRSRWFA